MVINSDDSDNATAFEVTDAPHIVLWWWKVYEFRVIIENKYSISPLGIFVQPIIVPTHVGPKEQRHSFPENSK